MYIYMKSYTNHAPHLLGNEFESLVLPYPLVGLPEDRVERLTSHAVVRECIRRHGKRRNPHLQWGGGLK